MRNNSFFVLCSLITMLLFSIKLKAQEHYFNYRGNQIPLTFSKNKISIKFKGSTTDQQITSFANEFSVKQNASLQKREREKLYVLNLNEVGTMEPLFENLKKRDEIEFVDYVYLSPEKKSEMLPFARFAVKFKPDISEAEVEALNKENNVEVIRKNNYSNRYILKMKPGSGQFLYSIVQQYNNNPKVEYALPDLLIKGNIHSNPNDTYFDNQYYLTNTNVPYAWDITTGSSQIKIAVIDDGGEVHPDLPSSRIVQGIDYYHGDNNPLYSDPNDGENYRAGNSYHGLCCAGIIAATQNNSVGISGVAPNCKIMFIRIYGETGKYFLPSDIIDGIDYAWRNGADVISMSFGIPDLSQWDIDQVAEVCDSAMTYGRNGKGCILVASIGNNADRYGNPVNYGQIECPANVPGVISVGAIDYRGDLLGYSPAGPSIDVVAYSGNLSISRDIQDWNDGCVLHSKAWPRGDIWTLDRPGNPGRRPGNYNYCSLGWAEFIYDGNYGQELLTSDENETIDYTGRFAGTSATCPQVSGLAALILSVNTNLTQAQVRNYITSGAANYPNFDQDVGYGKINTNRAVLCAKYNISGDYILVNPQSLSGTISQNTLVAGTNIKVTDNLTVNTGVNLVFEDGAIVKFNSGKRITVNGTIIAKNVMFQKNGTSDWYGIVVTGTGNASYIKYCTIKESQYGILIGGEKYIKIQNNYISGSSDAISIYNNGNPEIDNCYIQGGTEADVLSSANAMGRVTNCELSGTASSGHKNMGNAATVLNYYSNGRNNIKGRYGIASVYVLGGYPGYDYGIDVIERSYGCNFYNASGHTLYARYNCWGSSMNNSGPIVLNPVYPTCPPNPIGPDWQLQKSSQDALNEAWWAYSDGEFSKAEDLTEQVFNENKKGDRAGEALFLQMKCAHHLSSLSDNQNKLVSILSDKEVSAMAKYEAIRWQMIFELERKNIPSAKTLALSIPDTSNMSREILLSLAIGLIEELRDFEEAEKILSLYVAKSPEAKFPGEESAEKIKNEILSFYKGLYNGSDSSPKESPESVVSIIPEKYELLSNYPNPFNPTTTIKYTIPKESDVQVTIYDIMGREVKTIVSSRQEAGYKEVVWNGTDNNNQKVSSGIYIYRLRATSTEDLKVFDKSAKLILLK